MALHLPLAVSRIAHTVTVCILFECASTAQKWIAATLRNNVLFAKNGRLQILKQNRSTAIFLQFTIIYVKHIYIYIYTYT